MPPWSLRQFKEGFDDPYMFGNYVNEVGLIKTLSSAQEVAERFTEVIAPSELEIIYSQTCEEDPRQPVGFQFLGYDVAAPESPFWSLVADFPLNISAFRVFFEKLNENGLFGIKADAKNFLTAYRNHKVLHYDTPKVLWMIYCVECNDEEKGDRLLFPHEN